MIFVCTLYDWMATLIGHSFSTLLDFLDCCLLIYDAALVHNPREMGFLIS